MAGRLVYLTDAPIAQRAKLFENAPDVNSVKKVAEILGVSIATVRREINRGNLEAFHVGRSVRITKTALLKFVGEIQDEQ